MSSVLLSWEVSAMWGRLAFSDDYSLQYGFRLIFSLHLLSGFLHGRTPFCPSFTPLLWPVLYSLLFCCPSFIHVFSLPPFPAFENCRILHLHLLSSTITFYMVSPLLPPSTITLLCTFPLYSHTHQSHFVLSLFLLSFLRCLYTSVCIPVDDIPLFSLSLVP